MKFQNVMKTWVQIVVHILTTTWEFNDCIYPNFLSGKDVYLDYIYQFYLYGYCNYVNILELEIIWRRLFMSHISINFAATFHANPSTSKDMALVEYTPPSIRYNNTHHPSQGSYVSTHLC